MGRARLRRAAREFTPPETLTWHSFQYRLILSPCRPARGRFAVIAPFAPKTRGHVSRLDSPKGLPRCGNSRPANNPLLRRCAATGNLRTPQFRRTPAERRAERDGVTSYAGRSAPDRPLIGCEPSQSWEVKDRVPPCLLIAAAGFGSAEDLEV